jgi:ElaB/YqjD/DUF883 family membrane-anchored ribosome-binding protein
MKQRRRRQVRISAIIADIQQAVDKAHKRMTKEGRIPTHPLSDARKRIIDRINKKKKKTKKEKNDTEKHEKRSNTDSQS